MPRGAGGQALAHAPRGDHRGQQNPRQEAANEQVLDRNLRDDRIQDQRQRRRQQEPERSRGGQQSEREPIAIALFEERRKQHTTHGEDRHPRPAGERREECTENRADDSGAARNPAEPRAKHAQHPCRSGGLGQDEPGEREQRNGRQRGRYAERVGFDQDCCRRDAVRHEEQDGRPNTREDRRAHGRRREDEYQPGHGVRPRAARDLWDSMNPIAMPATPNSRPAHPAHPASAVPPAFHASRSAIRRSRSAARADLPRPARSRR